MRCMHGALLGYTWHALRLNPQAVEPVRVLQQGFLCATEGYLQSLEPMLMGVFGLQNSAVSMYEERRFQRESYACKAGFFADAMSPSARVHQTVDLRVGPRTTGQSKTPSCPLARIQPARAMTG